MRPETLLRRGRGKRGRGLRKSNRTDERISGDNEDK